MGGGAQSPPEACVWWCWGASACLVTLWGQGVKGDEAAPAPTERLSAAPCWAPTPRSVLQGQLLLFTLPTMGDDHRINPTLDTLGHTALSC